MSYEMIQERIDSLLLSAVTGNPEHREKARAELAQYGFDSHAVRAFAEENHEAIEAYRANSPREVRIREKYRRKPSNGNGFEK